ncbi:MAG TPA: RDD family protein [Thermoanaerobaculia bacterium]|nr:RDD family protein [Thermoanaerobaculia bacterium]HXK69129.1 RDD family protein [Thermoanaerobaculia bacterium]
MDRQLNYLRAAATVTDALLLLVVALAFGYLLTLLFQAVAPASTTVTYVFWRIWLGIAVVTFLLRDWYGSPGKRAFGIRVLGDRGKSITITQSIVRNGFLLLPLLNLYEAYRLLIQQKRRLGDILAGSVFMEE